MPDDEPLSSRQLPIFPLPLVMFPHEVLPLHIFEPRYRQMLDDVMAADKQFGVIYFDPETAIGDRPAEGSVGCIAEVRQTEILDDGRSNIITTGLERFRILEYSVTPDPYLVAEIATFSDNDETEDGLEKLVERARSLFERMARAAFKLSGGRGTVPEIESTDAETLSFLIAAAFNFDNEKKYRLLEANSSGRRLSKLSKILEQAVDQLEASAQIHSVSKTNGHGPRPTDL